MQLCTQIAHTDQAKQGMPSLSHHTYEHILLVRYRRREKGTDGGSGITYPLPLSMFAAVVLSCIHRTIANDKKKVKIKCNVQVENKFSIN